MVLSFNLKRFLTSLLLPLAVGGLSALITGKNMDLYSTIATPVLSPPSWVFPVVWTILYTLMGISLYIVRSSGVSKYDKQNALIFFFVQLFLNFIWSPIFFNKQYFLLASVVLLVLWCFSLLMVIAFYRISKVAGILQIPYIIWLTFAGYLNLAIYLLN